MLSKPNQNQNPWKAAALLGVISVDFVACLLLGYFGGAYISNRTGHQGFVVAGIVIGLFVGIVSIALIIRRFLEDTNE